MSNTNHSSRGRAAGLWFNSVLFVAAVAALLPTAAVKATTLTAGGPIEDTMEYLLWLLRQLAS